MLKRPPRPLAVGESDSKAKQPGKKKTPAASRPWVNQIRKLNRTRETSRHAIRALDTNSSINIAAFFRKRLKILQEAQILLAKHAWAKQPHHL